MSPNGANGVSSNKSATYADKLDAFRKSDAERDALVASLIADYEDLKVKIEEITDDYKNEVASRRMWQSKAASCEHNLEQALVEQKQVASSSNFALVLIDGDGAIFADHLYGMGRDGGAEAAHLLHGEIQKHLKSLYPTSNVDDWSIVVQVVLNLQGLATKLQSCGIIMNGNELLAFGRAFGLAQPLFNFTDVGGGKERADHKIRETMRLYMRNAQCKQVLFAPCHDNGYLPVLESYRREHAARITLIETRPAEPGFVELGLKRISIPRVFRSDNLPANPMKPLALASPTPSKSTLRGLTALQANSVAFVPPVAPKSSSPAPSIDSTSSAPASSWAVVGKSGVASKTINIAPKKTPARKFILLNVDGDRLDAELPRSDPAAENRYAERLKTSGKCCNSYHLTGKCEAGEYCDYVHGEKLSPGELLVLKHKARSRSCVNKFLCRDFNCTFGHHCKFGNRCMLDWCYFADSHNMDLEPARRLYEDGTEEWLTSYLEKTR